MRGDRKSDAAGQSQRESRRLKRAHGGPTGRPMAVFVVVADDAAYETARVACETRLSPVRVENAAQLWQLLPPEEPSIVLAEISASPGGLSTDELRELRTRFPWTTRVLLLPLLSGQTRTLSSLICTGVDEVVVTGFFDTVNCVRAALAGAELRMAGKEAHAALPARLSPLLERLVRTALVHVSECLAADDLAESEQRQIRALERRIRGQCRLTLREILLWARLLVATYLLEHSCWPVALIAWKVGFQESASLHRALRNRAGIRASELRAPGTLRAMCGLFMAALSVG